MTTSVSATAPLDLETEPTTDEFGVNVGEEISHPLESHLDRESPRTVPCNVGGLERQFRLGTGAVLVAAAAFAPVSRAWRIGFAVVGVAGLITGALRYCPLNAALGINTCRPDER